MILKIMVRREHEFLLLKNLKIKLNVSLNLLRISNIILKYSPTFLV